MDQSSQSAARRSLDVYFAITGLITYLGIPIFAITQGNRALHLPTDVRSSLIHWTIIVGGTCTIAWILRPPLHHIGYVYQVALRLGIDAAPQPREQRTTLLARRAIWSSCGTIAVSAFVLALGMDLGDIVGVVNIHGANLSDTTDYIDSVGAVCMISRLVGPARSEIDAAWRLARARADHEDGVRHFPRPAGS